MNGHGKGLSWPNGSEKGRRYNHGGLPAAGIMNL